VQQAAISEREEKTATCKNRSTEPGEEKPFRTKERKGYFARNTV